MHWLAVETVDMACFHGAAKTSSGKERAMSTALLYDRAAVFLRFAVSRSNRSAAETAALLTPVRDRMSGGGPAPRRSNGRTEGFNHGPRSILWRAYGMTNFENFHPRAFCAALALPRLNLQALAQSPNYRSPAFGASVPLAAGRLKERSTESLASVDTG